MKIISMVVLMVLLCSPVYAEVTSTEIRVALNQAQQYEYYSFELLPIIRSIDYLANENNIKISNKDEIAKAILKAAKSTGVDWKIILSVVFEESKFVNTVGDKKDNGKGYWSYGHMQVHFYWWGDTISKAGITKQDMLKPEYGIMIGSIILKKRIERYGIENGIRYYNGKSVESKQYMFRVLETYEKILDQSGSYGYRNSKRLY